MADFAQPGHAVKVKHLLLELLDHEVIKYISLRPNTESFSLVIELFKTNDASSSIYNIGKRLFYVLYSDIIFRYTKVFFDMPKLG